MSPEERREQCKEAINIRWSTPGARAEQANSSRAAFYRRFEDQVDPERVLPVAEREKLVASAVSAHMAGMRRGRARKAAQ